MGLFDAFFGPPDRDTFARMVADAIRTAGEPTPLRYDPEGFRLAAGGGEYQVFNLGNAYEEYCAAARSRRPDFLRQLVRSWFTRRKEVPTAFEDVGPDLLPAVRNRSYFELTRLHAQVEGLPALEWPHRVIGEHLAVSLVYDLPEALVQLQQHHLADWRVSFDDALETAATNLREISGQRLERAAPGVWVSPWRDNHDATRLILPELIREHAVAGRPVAMVPNRDTLILTGSEDEAGLAWMAARAEEAMEHPRFLTAVAFQAEEDDWAPFLPDASHPLHGRFKRMQVQSAGRDYGEQKGLLDALHEKTGEDVYVGAYSAVQDKQTGRVRSYCVWSRGVSTLLPRTDQVYFFVPRGEEGDVAATADWPRVQDVVGHRMDPVEGYPERYRVREFPSEEELAALDR